eukprot:99850-Rhodomonas_salina.1
MRHAIDLNPLHTHRIPAQVPAGTPKSPDRYLSGSPTSSVPLTGYFKPPAQTSEVPPTPRYLLGTPQYPLGTL